MYFIQKPLYLMKINCKLKYFDSGRIKSFTKPKLKMVVVGVLARDISTSISKQLHREIHKNATRMCVLTQQAGK